MQDLRRVLIENWREDAGSTYRTWFLWEERLKNFRSIRRGIELVVEEIEAGRFGNVYRGSSLEVIVHSIAEQRQIFKGADHAFLWKPKLRIPDIYENADNQRAFGQLLHHCRCCKSAEELISGIEKIDRLAIKGLGPAVANLLYFLHPTLMPPFNTAIVNGYNSLTSSKVKLGRWDQYLAMRRGILALNESYRDLLSNDLGAIAGLLFDIGKKRHLPPPVEAESKGRQAWLNELAAVREAARKSEKALSRSVEEDRSHSEVQSWLRDLGLALGFQVWVAANDRGRLHNGEMLGAGCMSELPTALLASSGIDSIKLIDVLWIDRTTGEVSAAFEVEHTTSIYSGIVRMLDLALGSGLQANGNLFLVAPNSRENDVRAQLRRPTFSRISDLRVRYLPYSELQNNRDAIAKFGTGLKGIHAISSLL